MNLNADLFEAFQNKLKTGNRRGVHLNAIPGNSRYKLDLAQLSEIHKSLPEHFIVNLLTQKNISFKFSIHDQFPAQNATDPQNETLSFEKKEEEKNGAATEENDAAKKLSKEEIKEKNKEKLSRSLENLIFQNEVIYSEKGVNSLGFGFPILIRKDVSDGQISASPLLIWSINMKPTNEMNTWEISRAEDDPIYLNEVLINHLQSDSGIILNQLSEEMLSDGKIDKTELLDICETILKQLKVSQNLDFIVDNYAEIPAIKTKAVYENILPKKGDAFLIKSGIFSIFEVQKQNIINDYEVLKSNFKPLENPVKLPFQSITSIETDPSQQEILESLKSQNKILIQGPPGTGKSQTLTAILVNALENKQKTIVVCEKQTALEVLYHALHNMGYARYCTMIKDSNSDRKTVVNSVRNTVDTAAFKKPIPSISLIELNTQIAEIIKNQDTINSVHHLLNTELLPNKNWTNIVGSFLEFSITKEKIDLNDLKFTFWKEEFEEIETILNSGAEIYQRYQPFLSLHFINSDQFTEDNFHSSLQNLDLTFQNYQVLWNEIQALVQNYKSTFINKKKREFSQNLERLNTLIDEVEIMTSTLDPEADQFLPKVTETFFYKLSALFSSSKRSKILTQKKLISISAEVKQYSLDPYFSPVEISGDLWNNRNEIIRYRKKVETAQNDFSINVEKEYHAIDYNNLFSKSSDEGETALISDKIQSLRNLILYENWTENKNFGSNYFETKGFLNSILEKYAFARNHSENPLLMEYNWFSFYEKLSVFQKSLLEKLYQTQNWKSLFLSSYYLLLLNHHSNEKLNFKENNYSEIIKKLADYGVSQKKFIEQFWNNAQQEAVKKFETANNDLTVANLYNKRSSINHTRLTLRQIAQKDTDLFTTFFPIILTTPDVCSNLFQNKNYYFDYVVFDEASQLKLEDNLPALLKGKNIIIAGDEHQMPPSNYFSKVFEGTIEDEDEIEGDNEIITYKNAMLNIESLLDFAMENNFEKNHLDFHYRSRHPYLIDFSNHAFYNSRLKPLPAQTENKPIEFFQVDGIFDDHINNAEAEKVIEILATIEPEKDGKYPSVGIATFNITQRNYIKRKIVHQSNLPENEAFKEKIQGLEEAGLFIKNLENIQGDERDIIIISTTYGRKPSGKFVQSFGPVNQSKGYKLLNVIITRAKEKIYICNSIPEEFFMNYKDAIEEEGANNRKAVFYAYLAYCKSVSNQNEKQRNEVLNVLDVFGHKASTEKDAETNTFIEELHKQLTIKFPALKISKNHHFGGYVLDLLIEKANGKSIIIECMSKEKYSGDLAYLEDLHKAKILKNSGFGYVRIWSQNCWQNLDAEIEKIERLL